jgi:hypothetical protein
VSRALLATLVDEAQAALEAWKEIRSIEEDAGIPQEYQTPPPSLTSRVSLSNLESIEQSCSLEMVQAKENNDPGFLVIKKQLREIRRIRRSARYQQLPKDGTLILGEADYLALRELL